MLYCSIARMGSLCSFCGCLCSCMLSKYLLQAACEVLQLRRGCHTILQLLLLLLPPSLLPLQLLNTFSMESCDLVRV